MNLAYIVTDLKCKKNSAGDARGGGITNKFRITVADKAVIPVDSS